MTADHAGQTGGERDLCAVITSRARIGVQIEGLPINAGQLDDLLAHVLDPVREYLARPVPPAGQAAREAAVEAVARDELAESIRDELAQWPIGSGYYSTTVSTSDATEMVDVILPLIDAYVAALSAAPGQEPLHEWNCPNCGATTRARMADHPGQEQGR